MWHFVLFNNLAFHFHCILQLLNFWPLSRVKHTLSRSCCYESNHPIHCAAHSAACRRQGSQRARGIMQDYYTGFGRRCCWLRVRGVAHIFIFDARVFMQPGRRRGIAAQMQHNKAPLLTHCPPVISPLSLSAMALALCGSERNIYIYMHVSVCSKLNCSCGMSSIQFGLCAFGALAAVVIALSSR